MPNFRGTRHALRKRSTILPSDIPGLVRWYKADAITGLADAAAVSSWTDIMGVSNAVQATGARQPTYRTNVQNGLPVVRFDGTDDALAFTASTAAQTSIFLVAKVTAGTNDYLIGGTNGSAAPAILTGYSSLGMEAYHIVAAGQNRATLVSPATAAWKVVGYTLNDAGGAGSFAGYANGVQMFSNVIDDLVTGTGFNTLGASATGGGDAANTDIAEVLIYSVAVSPTQALGLMKYLNARWAVY